MTQASKHWAGLSQLQKKFTELYAASGNGADSYMKAGYSVKNPDIAKSAGSRLLTNVNVKRYLAHLQGKAAKRAEVTVEDIAAKAAELAFGPGLEAIVERSEGGNLKIKERADLSLLDSLSFSESDGEKGRSTGFSFKRESRAKALDVLAKLTGGYERKRSTEGDSEKLDPQRILDALGRLRK